MYYQKEILKDYIDQLNVIQIEIDSYYDRGQAESEVSLSLLSEWNRLFHIIKKLQDEEKLPF